MMDEWANLVEKERSQGLLKTAEPLDVGRLINYDEENTNLPTPVNPHGQQHDGDIHFSKGNLRRGG